MVDEKRQHEKAIDQHIENEQKIIHLMLRYRDVVDEMLDNTILSDFFYPNHQPLIDAIYREFYSSESKRLLTRESYRQMLLEENIGGDMALNLSVYDRCLLGVNAHPNDLGHLKKRLIEGYVGRKSYGYIKEFTTAVKQRGYTKAARDLADNLESSLTIADTRKTIFATLPELKDEYLQDLDARKEDKTKIIRCNFPELDNAITVGFRPMHLTLFVADVGSHKTNLMLNVALEIFEQGYNVLFIPLEMDRFDLVNRIVANRTGVPFTRLVRPGALTTDDRKKIEEAKFWLEKKNHFCILDADERTSVSSLKREIEKRAFAFKPQVVIIDYIANLKPDIRFGQRNDLEIGEILKSLRFLGKRYGFHIISAAQMGRAAIKSLREGKEEAIDSTAVHGSHQYSADSDTIFALTRRKDEPDRLNVIVIKARYGPSGDRKELRVDPETCRIYSTEMTQVVDEEYNSEQVDNDMNRSQNEISDELGKVNIDFTAWNDLDEDDPLGDL